MAIRIEVSVGEFLDKLTILEIKSRRIADPERLANVRRERDALRAAWVASAYANAALEPEYSELHEVNAALWEIEDRLRAKEAAGAFDAEFVELARSVYLHNDRRAEVKRRLNLRLGSGLIEEKSYTEYRRPERGGA